MFRHRQFLQLLQAFEDGSVLQQKQAIQDCLPNLEKLLVFKVRYNHFAAPTWRLS